MTDTALPLPVHRPAAIPGRPLAALALAVLAAHLLLLWQRPPAFAVNDLPDGAVRMVTRQVVPAAPPAAAPPPARVAPAPRHTAPAAPSRPTTANSPVSEQKQPIVSAEYGVSAPENIAIVSATPAPPPAPEPAVAVAAAAAPAPASAPTPEAGPPAASAPPVQLPGAVKLKYSVSGMAKGLNYSASAELLWKPDGARYDARLTVGAFLLGSRVQTSTGQLTPQGLAPTRFSDKSRSEQATHFEREKNLITFSGNAPQVALQPGAQDRLSVVFQLAGLLAADAARYPAGSTVSVQTAGPRDAAVWTFEVAGEENLRVGSGEVRAIRLVRPPRHEFDQKVELWFAPSLNFLPIRIKLTQVRGDFVDQVYESSETP